MKQFFKRKNFAALPLIFLSLTTQAQKIYPANQTDLIFSMAQMNATAGVATTPVVRFSGFINHELQIHFELSKTIGVYSGWGIKNIGMINHMEYKGVNFKQRAYALSMPLALKMGNLKEQGYLAVGTELNVMTHYKEKFLYDETKVKKSEWFSNKVNLLNPAVFLQVKFFKSQVITLKYFLNDFLRYQPGGLTLPDGTVISDYGKSSKLFYISWGTHIHHTLPDDVKQKQKELEKLKSARWVD